jgi:hypothetical protein
VKASEYIFQKSFSALIMFSLSIPNQSNKLSKPWSSFKWVLASDNRF